MFREPYNNCYQTPMWRGVPMFPEPPMRPLPYTYNNDNTRQNTNQKSMSPTPAVMQQPIKTMPQVHADQQNLEIPPTTLIINNPLYNQGWLKTQIGNYIKVGFLIGTNTFQDRTGILQEVGISFIVLKDVNTNDLTMCDIYSIKFVTVYSDPGKCMT